MAKKIRQGPVVGSTNAKAPSRLVSDSNMNTETNPKVQFTKLSSLSLKTVTLHDWWLVKAQKGEGLAVGGFASRGSIGVRSFYSAAIAKRHDATTLETVDGITIRISGIINRSHTHLNGFTLEVCNHFLLGFPYYWNEFATQCCGNISSDSYTNTVQPVSLDNIPVTRVRDYLVSPRGDSDNDALKREIFNVVLRKFSCNIAANETPSNPMKSKAKRQYKGHDGILDAREIRTEEFLLGGQSRMEMDILSPSEGVATRSMSNNVDTDVRSPTRTASSVQIETPSSPIKEKVNIQYKDNNGQFEMNPNFITPIRGVVTRSMSKLKNLGSKGEENLSLQSSVQHRNRASVLTSKAARIQSAERVTRSVSRSEVRRSNRLRTRKESIH